MKLFMNIYRVDNGFIIAYPTGEKVQNFFGVEHVTGHRFCQTVSELSDTVKAMCERTLRNSEAMKELEDY